MANRIYAHEINHNKMIFMSSNWFNVRFSMNDVIDIPLMWIEENCEGRYCYWGLDWYFELEEDATAFKLRFI